MSNDNPASASSYPPFRGPPKFESQIPEHLLADATPFEKHVMSELSIMRQSDAWTVETVAGVHEMVTKTNGKVNKAQEDIKAAQADIEALQQDKRTVVGGWRAIVAFCTVFAAVFGFALSVYAALTSR